jgi:hypothetical protein
MNFCNYCYACAEYHAAELAAKEKYIEVQDVIISGQRKEIGTKDAEIARLRAALDDLRNLEAMRALIAQYPRGTGSGDRLHEPGIKKALEETK